MSCSHDFFHYYSFAFYVLINHIFNTRFVFLTDLHKIFVCKLAMNVMCLVGEEKEWEG